MGNTPADEPKWLAVTLSTIGSSFVALLRAIVPPLVFLAIVASIANLKQVTNAARLAGQTLLWFAITALVSVGIGIGLGLLTTPASTPPLRPRPPRTRPAPARGWTSSPGSSPRTSSACRHRPRPPTTVR